MYIKRYALTAFLFILFIGWYVYAFVTQESMGLRFLGIELPSLSIALWIVVPLIFLALASAFHMFFYSFLGTLKLRKYEKDYEKLIDALADAYLGKTSNDPKYKTPRYQLLGSLVADTHMIPSDKLASSVLEPKLAGVLKAIESIKKGEVADLKKYGLATHNPLMIQNQKNRYEKGELNCEEILSHPSKYDAEVARYAYVDFVKTAPMYAIEKYKGYLTKEALYEIMARINADTNTLEVSNETLVALIGTLELDAKEYIKLSSILAAHMVPEQRMKLFEMLSEKKEDAMQGYLYTLFDLEMLAPADDILENSQPDEFLNFKSYRALKECNKNFNINLFI
ncbi:MAG: hypothetical protein AB7U24_02510 [Sulfurimonadaceae bacterium]